MEWRDMKDAPKDGTHILLYGEQKHGVHDQVRYREPIRFSGFFDTLDEAWVSTCSTWLGPFFEPTAWMPLPELPK